MRDRELTPWILDFMRHGLGVREHEARLGPDQQLIEQWPGRTRLDHHLERPIRAQRLDEPVGLGVADAERLPNERSVFAHDPNDRIRCVSIDSCDIYDGLLVVGSRRILGRFQRSAPSAFEGQQDSRVVRKRRRGPVRVHLIVAVMSLSVIGCIRHE
jgi:hypothetical protein